MNELAGELYLDRSGLVVVALLCGIFAVGYAVATHAGLLYRFLQWLHGFIAVYGPTEWIRRLAWDAVKRLHKWDAARILLYPSSRTEQDSPSAAAWVISQEGTPESEAVLEAAENDPTLCDHVDVITSAKVESSRVRAHPA
jgi:hypothetical protein